MLDISGILDDVVHQFTDPLAFFRELVQNSIDAGTGEVDIDVSFDDGLMTASVTDYGGGMTREIIETQLCRLFSSPKHGDLTKIGRFGIGFVSVYGVSPDFVCVDTGRDGESWRVLFLPDRTWELYSLRHPVEGTQVRVVKEMSAEEFEEFRSRAEEVVSRWCRHVRVPVRFDGRDVRRPFEIDSPCAVEFEEEGTRLVAGLVTERAPRCGFYNKGLMLKETDGSPWPHFAFKIDSRYLEHTLTRDDLMHDRNYDRASELLERFATRDLPRRLLDDLETAAEAGQLEAVERLLMLLGGLVRSAPATVSDWKQRSIVPTVDGVTSPTACEASARNKTLWFTDRETDVARRVAGNGTVVRAVEPELWQRLLKLRLRDVNELFVALDRRPWSTVPRGKELVGGLRKLLLARDIEPERIWLGGWSGPQIAHATDAPEGPVSRRELDRGNPLQCDGRELVLNLEHRLVHVALDAAPHDPSLAAAAILAALDPTSADEVVRIAHRSPA